MTSIESTNNLDSESDFSISFSESEQESNSESEQESNLESEKVPSKKIETKSNLENAVISKQEIELKLEETISSEQTDDSKYYSMIKKEYLINDKLILSEEYSKARSLLTKIKNNHEKEIVKAEEENFKEYLVKQSEIIKAKLVNNVTNYIVLNLYIMFYSKYHLINNNQIYGWINNSIGIVSSDKFSLIINYYTKTSYETFVTYLGAMDFKKSKNSCKNSEYSFIRFNKNFTCDNLDLKSIQDSLYTNKLRKQKPEQNKRKFSLESNKTNKKPRSNIIIVDDKISEKDENEKIEAVLGLINFKKYKKINTTENPAVSVIDNLSEVVCKTYNFDENKKKILNDELHNCIKQFIKSNSK